MIATHHIKVNGRWIKPGEEYDEKPEKKVAEKEPEKPVKAEEPVKEIPKEPEAKPKATARRKVSK